MCNVKGSAALVIAAAAMIMFLTGCETTKHAEVMSDEELAAQAQASGSQGSGKGSGGEQGGIPLAGQGMSEGSLSVADSSGTAAGTGSSESINPVAPPSPTLSDASMGGDISGGSADSGTIPSGSDFSDLMSEYPTGNRSPPASFGPESPPQAHLQDGAESFAGGPTRESMGSSGAGMTGSTVETGPHGYEGQEFVRALTPSDFVPEGLPYPSLGGDSGMGTSDSSGSGEEVVSLPDDSGAGASMEPLSQNDLDGGLGHVFFDFDQYVIRDDAVSTLQENAQLLSAKYQDSSVLIEGHCDERGTSDYNLVLGERRAQAVKDYLVNLGVSSSRIQIVSYGKERPSCTESTEACMQKNRRGHTALQ